MQRENNVYLLYSISLTHEFVKYIAVIYYH